MSDQPAGWRSMLLNDAGTWLSGGTPYTDEPRYWNGDIPWISAASLKDFRISRSDRCITEAGARAGTKLVPPGTVLFMVRGMSLKNEFRVGVTERQVAFGQDCKAILPAPEIDGKFLALALKARSRQILEMVDEAGHGTGRLPTDLISKLEIGVPDRAEQRRLAEILDAVDQQIESDGALIGKAQLLHSAVVHDALRRATIACRYLTVGSFFQIKSGITLGPLREPRAHACRYLKVANVHRGAIDLADIAELEASPSEQAELRLRSGDLLVVEGHANPNEIGRCALVGEDAAGLLYQNHLFRLRSDVVEPEFGELWLNSSAARAYWRRMCATSSGLYTINSRMLRDLPFPDLTLDAQMEVVNAQQAVAGKIKTQQAELAKLRTLKQGLMDDLLTGRVRVGGAPVGASLP